MCGRNVFFFFFSFFKLHFIAVFTAGLQVTCFALLVNSLDCNEFWTLGSIKCVRNIKWHDFMVMVLGVIMKIPKIVSMGSFWDKYFFDSSSSPQSTRWQCRDRNQQCILSEIALLTQSWSVELNVLWFTTDLVCSLAAAFCKKNKIKSGLIFIYRDLSSVFVLFSDLWLVMFILEHC